MSHHPTPTTAEQFAALAVEMRAAAQEEEARAALLAVVRVLILTALASLCDALARLIAQHQAGLLPAVAPAPRPRATAHTGTASATLPSASPLVNPHWGSAHTAAPCPAARTASSHPVPSSPAAPHPRIPTRSYIVRVLRPWPITAPPRRHSAAALRRAEIPPHTGFVPIRDPPLAKTAGIAGRLPTP